MARSPANCALPLALCALGGASQASPIVPITNGTPDVGDAGVVALLDQDELVCSGTLVAPRLVLTAAHCIGPADQVLFGSALDAEGDVRAIVYQVAHPDFMAGQPAADLGLLVLDEPAPPAATPWPLASFALAPDDVRRSIRIVGFGLTMSDADLDPARKRGGTAVISSVDDATFEYTADPSQTCAGDSGGPAFLTIDGVEYLVGVTSAGDILCDSGATDVRVDRYAGPFVQPLIDAIAGGATPRGCWSPEPGACPPAGGCDAGTGGSEGLLGVMIAALVGCRRRARRRPGDAHAVARRPSTRAISSVRRRISRRSNKSCR